MKKYAGNTPMIQITYKYLSQIYSLYAKLEYYNPSGSIKDRIASYIIDRASAAGKIKEGQPIIETTSGNTGIALAAYGALTKHPVYIFMPDWVSSERIRLMEMYGANVTLVSRKDGGFGGALERAALAAKESDAFALNQFANKDNAMAHYTTTAEEILSRLPDADCFISGVGSGGTITGIGKKLKEKNNAKIIAIEPACAQTLAGKPALRQHKIEGIGDDFVPALLDRKIIDALLPIDDDDAVAMAAKLAKELGLGVGISSGANFLGAVLASAAGNKKVVTVFADDNKKYLSTVLSDAPAPGPEMLSSRIELLDWQML